MSGRGKDLLTFLGDAAEKFDFGKYYDGEQNILKPALEARGYTDVQFRMIERDSFGPLIRGCRAKNVHGVTEEFFYG